MGGGASKRAHELNELLAQKENEINQLKNKLNEENEKVSELAGPMRTTEIVSTRRSTAQGKQLVQLCKNLKT